VSEEKSLHGNFKKYGFIKKATPEGGGETEPSKTINVVCSFMALSAKSLLSLNTLIDFSKVGSGLLLNYNHFGHNVY
jgi:hypothetical protein